MPQDGKSKLLDAVRDRLRFKHYSLRTEQAYVGWIRRFILFHRKRHPQEMGAEEVTAFLGGLGHAEPGAVGPGVSVQGDVRAGLALAFQCRARQEAKALAHGIDG
ncbi:MAG: phage integrase N-terminal SAM-like domain-containing protein [Gallionellaceae bacterium]